MNREQYNSDPRYAKVLETMDLLGIMDVTTTRQHKNGTVVWKLPIKNWNSGKTNIEVASFSTGYVRNQNSGYSNYQLNKRCQSNPQYYPEQKYNPNTGEHVKTGKYLKFTTRGCELISVEIDRLEYLLKYCIKNYYIKHANQVPNGDFVPKWQLEHTVSSSNKDFNGHRDRIEFLQSDVDEHVNTIIKLEEKLFDYKEEYKNRASEVNELQEEINILKEYIDRVQKTVNNG